VNHRPTTAPSAEADTSARFQIGEAARQARLSAKMVRHYESLGLLGQLRRSEGGYRLYSEADVHRLRFIQRGRALGFSMAEIGELLSLWGQDQRASASVKRIAQQHVDDLSRRIAAMQAMQRALQDLLQHCTGDDRPDCPILDDLAGVSPCCAPANQAPAAAVPP